MSKNLNGAGGAKKTTQVLIGVAALILAGGGGALFLLNSKISEQTAAATQKEAEVGTSEQIAKRYDGTLADYQQSLTRVQFLESSVSQKSYVPTLLKQLQSLAAATHLTVTAVRPSGFTTPAAPDSKNPDGSERRKAAAPPYDTMDIAVDATGTYADTSAFLYGLTRFPKIVEVTSAQFHPGGPVPGGSPLSSPMVSTNLHLTAFVFHDDDSATQPLPSSARKGGPVIAGAAEENLPGPYGRAVRGARTDAKNGNERTQYGASAL